MGGDLQFDEAIFVKGYLLNSGYVKYFIINREPLFAHKYAIMDRIPDDMLEEIMNNKEQE